VKGQDYVVIKRTAGMGMDVARTVLIS